MAEAAVVEQQAPQESQQETVVQTPEQAEVSFAAGYNKVKGTEPETAQTTEQKETQTAETAQNNVAAVAAVEAPRMLGYTEAELKAELAKAGQVDARASAEIRKIHSKFGEFNRTLQELQKTLSAAKSGRKISAEQLKRVNEELPGLGAALAQDLSDVLGGAVEAQAAAESKGQTFDPDKYYAEKLNPALQKLEARIVSDAEQEQNELLAELHPDFESFLKTDDFKKWLQTLPADRQKAVRESPRARVAAKAITDAKAWAAAQKKAAAKNQNRLEAAITPKGGGAAPAQQQPDDEASFRKGYNKAKGK